MAKIPEFPMFLVYQLFVIEENASVENGNINNIINISTVIRKVKAISKEEAIGKFVLGTSNISCKKKIDPISCDELEKIITIE